MSGDRAWGTRTGERRPTPHDAGVDNERRAVRCWSKTTGAVAGAVSALAFTALHGALIVDIWDRAGAMALAGALCGTCLAWSYASVRVTWSVTSWLAYNGLHVVLLVALGIVSLVLLEPTASMAELVASTDPLGDLVPSALPLMAWASVVGTGVVWATSGRGLGSLPAVFITQVLLVVLIGHNFAILGLVELPDVGAALATFVGVTVFLGASFAVSYLLLDAVVARIAA